MDKIKDIQGVQSVKSRLWGYYYDPIVGANYTLMVPENSEVGAGKIVIGQGISRARLAFEGDVLEFKSHEGTILNLEVKSLFSPESELVSADLILVSEEDFRKLFGGSKDLGYRPNPSSQESQGAFHHCHKSGRTTSGHQNHPEG